MHVKDIMKVEQQEKSLVKYDFSMCFNEGQPMRLDDVPKFYRSNYEKNLSNMPYINVFTLEYIDGVNDLMLPKGVETLGESVKKYVITQYFLSKDYDEENGDKRECFVLG